MLVSEGTPVSSLGTDGWVGAKFLLLAPVLGSGLIPDALFAFCTASLTSVSREATV